MKYKINCGNCEEELMEGEDAQCVSCDIPVCEACERMHKEEGCYVE